MTSTENVAVPQQATRSTSTGRGLRSSAGLLACATPAELTEFLDGLDANALAALPYIWEVWAFEHQLPPEGDWRSWVILGGRGAGKTRAGAEWVRSQVEGAGPLDPGRARRIALVGETYDQARDVMVFGQSGIMAVTPPDRQPNWIASRRQLVWPNGAVAQVFSGRDAQAMRGPQFDAAWVDELAKWPNAQEAWDMLQFALRLGDQPQQVVTTTPQPIPLIKDLIKRDSTVMTHAATEANAAYLARSFLAEVRERYAGTALGRQELDGELLEDLEGALWSYEGIEASRVTKLPAFDRVVVAVDPPVTGHKKSDACGIVVAGVVYAPERRDWRAYVLEDGTVQGVSPRQWAEQTVRLAERWKADRVIAEVNQGGDLVEEVLRQVDAMLPVTKVRATSGKTARAEPVAAMYEQGKVHHTKRLGALEDQMCKMNLQGYQGAGSPDRVDALVWALHGLMIAPNTAPKMRIL